MNRRQPTLLLITVLLLQVFAKSSIIVNGSRIESLANVQIYGSFGERREPSPSCGKRNGLAFKENGCVYECDGDIQTSGTCATQKEDTCGLCFGKDLRGGSCLGEPKECTSCARVCLIWWKKNGAGILWGGSNNFRDSNDPTLVEDSYADGPEINKNVELLNEPGYIQPERGIYRNPSLVHDSYGGRFGKDRQEELLVEPGDNQPESEIYRNPSCGKKRSLGFIQNGCIYECDGDILGRGTCATERDGTCGSCFGKFWKGGECSGEPYECLSCSKVCQNRRY